MEALSSTGGQLIYRPHQTPPLLFRPAAGVIAPDAVEHLFDLMAELKARLSAGWRDEWVLPLWLSLSLFPVEELAGASDDRLAEMLEQSREFIARWKQLNPQQHEANERRALSGLRQRLHALIEKYVYELDRTSGWDTGRKYVEAHPVLLSDEADALLEGWVRREGAQGKEKAVGRLQQLLRIFRLSREVGVGAAFAEAQAEALRPLYPDISAEEVKTLITTPSPASRLEQIRKLLAGVSPEQNLAQWVALQIELGNALAHNAEASGETRRAQLQEALAAYEQALAHIDPTAHPDRWAGVMSNVGHCRMLLGEFDRASESYQQAQTSTASEIDARAKAALDMSLAGAYFNQALAQNPPSFELLERVIQLGESAIPSLELAKHPVEYPRLLAQMALCYASRESGVWEENIKRGSDLIMEAAGYVTDGMHARDIFLIGRTKGNYCYYEMNDLDGAYAGYALAVRATEEMYGYAARPDAQDEMLRLAASVYDSVISVCARKAAADGKFAREALVFIEGNKSRTFRDQLGRGDIPHPPALASPLLLQEREFLERLKAADVEISDAAVPESRKAELAMQSRGLKEQLSQVWRELEATPQGAEYVALRRSAAPDWQTFSALAELLGPDAAIVEFYTRNQNTLALTLRAGDTAPGLHALPLSNAEIIARYAYTYHEEILHRPLLADDPTHDWLNLGRELLEPLEPALAGTRLVYFIPHGILHVFPLHALTVSNEPFIARRAAAYAPSAAVLNRVLRRQLEPDGRTPMLSVGYTHREEEREVFLGEARDVAELFGTSALLDDEATLDNLRARAPGAARIHLSCHGYFVSDAPMSSSVLLAGGECSALAWMRMSLAADLVTISACEVGWSEVSSGDEVMSLTRALLYAGASATLSPLWSVNALSTREWMSEFYRQITPGRPAAKAEAFRQATLAIRRRRPDPWHWAPFMLAGDWR